MNNFALNKVQNRWKFSIFPKSIPWFLFRMGVLYFLLAACLRNFPGPCALVVAENDELIPAASSRRFYESLPGRKKLWLIPNAGHNTWFDRTTTAWRQELKTFLTTAFNSP